MKPGATERQALTDVGVGITGGVDVSVTGPAGATRISLGGIALDTLSVLGVRPVVGRWFERDEVTVEGDTAATLVISYGVWQDYFGRDPDVVGKTIPGWDAAWGRTIIGVMPPDFWVDPSMADVKGWFAFNVGRFPGARAQTLARLNPGVDYRPSRGGADDDRHKHRGRRAEWGRRRGLANPPRAPA